MNVVTLCYVVCRNEAEAVKIGRALVKEKLAACANIVPCIRSIFFWKGKPCEEREALLLAKTVTANRARVEKRVKQLHSYDLPCICFYEGKATKEYGAWVERQTHTR